MPSLGLVVLLVACVGTTGAATQHVPAEEGALETALQEAAPGDTLVLQPGIHQGPIFLTQPLTMTGQPGAIVDGGGQGRVVTVDAPNVRVTGLTVRGSGTNLAEEDSGIFLTEQAVNALVDDNQLLGNLIGVNLKGPKTATIRDNTIVGRQDLRVNERGNGVQVWNSPGSVVVGNQISHGRDGIFVTTSRDNVFRDNRLMDVRFAIHYMYADNSRVIGNISNGNHIGFALMYSSALVVEANRSVGDRDRGILLNYTNQSEIRNNQVLTGPEKCVFIYNANINRIRGNRFEGCQIGIHFTAGSERNEIVNNAFVNNRTQVKYVGTRIVEWSHDRRGNYWSDNTAFDVDADGIADRPYQPNDLVDQLLWRYPLAKLLLNSPALQLLRWAQSSFPALHPGGVVDSAPLMMAPQTAETENG